MACETWGGKLDAYLDGELASAEDREFSAHLRTCPACTADALERVRLKRSVAIAGKRYQASSEFRAKVTASLQPKPRRKSAWFWAIVTVPAMLALIAAFAANLYIGRERAQRERVYSELTDLHVAVLASANPVDVLSTDRHTVKPWFQGKVPFTFNLPELQGSEFSLVGGRVTYLEQVPGAHLIYQVRQHKISVLIFPDRGPETANLRPGSARALSFNVENWSQNGLRYFVVGDVNSEDIQALSKLLRDAG